MDHYHSGIIKEPANTSLISQISKNINVNQTKYGYWLTFFYQDKKGWSFFQTIKNSYDFPTNFFIYLISNDLNKAHKYFSKFIFKTEWCLRDHFLFSKEIRKIGKIKIIK